MERCTVVQVRAPAPPGRGSVRRRSAATVGGALCWFALVGCSQRATTTSTAPCPPSSLRHSPPLVIAHAGGEGLAPANSILAMQRSMAAGADVLDADLRMTADGVVVAHHDRSIAADTDRTGNIDELTWAELQLADLRAGWSGAAIDQPVRIASLEQILATFPVQMISLEIKQSLPAMALPLCEVLQRLGAVDRVYLSANNDADVYAAQAECPGSLVITTTYRDVAVMRSVRETGAPWCAPAPIGQPPFGESLLDPENVAWSHEHGMAIFTWTVDDPETLRGLAKAGVDGVYTRRPDVARAVFDELASE